MRTLTLLITALMLPLMSPATGEAQDGSGSKEPRWSLKLETFLPMTLETAVRFDFFGDRGQPISYERELGLEDELSQFRGSISARLGASRRHEIELSYHTTSRDSLAVIKTPIDIGETVIPAQVEVFARAKSEDFEFNYKYYFVHTEKGELGLIVGAHNLRYDTSVAATLSVPGEDLDLRASVRSDKTAPVPLIGLKGDRELASKWHLNGSVKWLDAHYDVWNGTFLEVQVALEHHTWKNLGFGIGYSYDDLDLKEDEDPDAINLGIWEQTRKGPIAFLRARF